MTLQECFLKPKKKISQGVPQSTKACLITCVEFTTLKDLLKLMVKIENKIHSTKALLRNFYLVINPNAIDLSATWGYTTPGERANIVSVELCVKCRGRGLYNKDAQERQSEKRNPRQKSRNSWRNWTIGCQNGSQKVIKTLKDQ